MSISVFWLAATGPATPLPQPLAPPTGSPVPTPALSLISLGVVVWLLAAGAGLKRWKVWRPGNIVGPARTGESESVWTQVFIFGYGLFGGALTAVGVGRLLHGSAETRALLLTSAAEAVAWVILVGMTARLRPQGVRRLGLSPRRLPSGAAVGLAAIAVVFPLVAGASELTGLYLQWTGRPMPAPHEVLQSLLNPQSRWMAAVSVGVAVGVAPLFEELAFRGFLQTVLGRVFQWIGGNEAAARWTAVAITAAAFAAVHGVAAFAPALFLLAVGLGYVYERTGNLWATITMHATFNAVQIGLFLAVAHG